MLLARSRLDADDEGRGAHPDEVADGDGAQALFGEGDAGELVGDDLLGRVAQEVEGERGGDKGVDPSNLRAWLDRVSSSSWKARRYRGREPEGGARERERERARLTMCRSQSCCLPREVG